jgi:uncharacterized protein YidB (DUF937 family)
MSYPPVPVDSVAVYLSVDDVPGDYEKVALITAEGDFDTTSREGMIEKVREEAAMLGANGVLLERIEEPGTGGKVSEMFLGVGGERKGRMLAIRVMEDS